MDSEATPQTEAEAPASAPIVPERPRVEEPTAIWSLDLPDEAATHRLAHVLAGEVGAGDLITLSGDLGAGKSTFARAFIREKAGDAGLEVPSPTFTLVQHYDTPSGVIVHADFYRINPDDLVELGWDETTADALTLVEWPERAGAPLAPDRIDVALRIVPGGRESRRYAVLTGFGRWATRLATLRAIRSVLDTAGWGEATRTHMQGDASTRAYERLIKPSGDTAVLMISPRRPDGPPVRRGKPYSAIAHLAESVHAFVAMAKGLRALSFSAPEIIAGDLDAGVLLIEDLGREPVVDAAGPLPERYEEAARLLARLHGLDLPHALPVADGIEHAIPPYDLDALLIEVELLLDWYVPFTGRPALAALPRAQFVAAWLEVLRPLVSAKPTWVLRDYHSPNLIWLPARHGVRRVGLLDFQDAVLGHPAYDAVSLMQDARVDVPAGLELRLLGAYATARREAEPDFDLSAFAGAYAVLGAQRATKIAGIFARLDRRDGKPHYLRHMPRIEAYLARNLAHPVLTPVRGWYETHLPRIFGTA